MVKVLSITEWGCMEYRRASLKPPSREEDKAIDETKLIATNFVPPMTYVP
jgi:hypothetical protein